MGYRVTVVNPTGFPLSADPDGEGRVQYRPKIGGKRVTVHVPDEDADVLREEHDRLVAARHQRALSIREATKQKRKAAAERAKAKKKSGAKKSASKKTTSAKKPAKKPGTAKKPSTAKKASRSTSGPLEYAIAIKGPKKTWPTVTGTPVGEHFGIHKREDGQFSLTHLPTGLSVATGKTKKRLNEVGETLTGVLGKHLAARSGKTLATKMRATKNLSWWIRDLTSGKTKDAFADYSHSIRVT